MRPAAVTGTAAGFSVSGGRIAFIRRLLPIGGQGGGEKDGLHSAEKRALRIDFRLAEFYDWERGMSNLLCKCGKRLSSVDCPSENIVHIWHESDVRN